MGRLLRGVVADGVVLPEGTKSTDPRAAYIQNPVAWDDGKPPVLVETTDPADESPDDAEVPPKGGPGSGREAWVAYASARAVAVQADATREQIIEALEAAGVPTEA